YGDRPASPMLVFLFATMRWTMVFFIWMAFYFGVALLRQRQEAELAHVHLETALQASELRSLKSQLNPHFLFNALNSVRALIADDPKRAQTAVTQLARILRYTLGTTNDESVSVEREMQVVDDYLGLEALRLADRLVVERHVSNAVNGARIPI